MSKSGGNGDHLSNELKYAQTMKPSVWCSYRLENVFIQIAVIVEQSQDIQDEIEVYFFAINFLVYPSNQNRKDVIEQFGTSFFKHLLSYSSDLRLVVESIDLIHNFLCHFVYFLCMVLLAHRWFGNRVDQGIESWSINLPTLIDKVTCRFAAIVLHTG